MRSQPVVVGTADGNAVVITQGLTPGMRVVATGGHVLAPDQKVTVYQGPGVATPGVATPGVATPGVATPAVAQPTPATR
ncbi:hypothetical protein D3C71_2114870 [compost metagenome]